MRNFAANGGLTQSFLPQVHKNDLDKAAAGFVASGSEMSEFTKLQPVMTGNWGGGAFLQFSSFKWVDQWLAGSLVGRPLVFVPFDTRLHSGIPVRDAGLLYLMMYHLTVGSPSGTKGKIKHVYNAL